MQPRTTAQHRTYVGLLFNLLDDLVLIDEGTGGGVYSGAQKTVIYCCFDTGLSLQKHGFDVWPINERSGGHTSIGTYAPSFRQSVSFHQS